MQPFRQRGNPRAPTRGFTLIELIIVIAIIGLLAAIIIAALAGAQTKSRDARRVADIKEIQNALALYATKHNAYPSSLSQLVVDNDITTLPTDPSSGAEYAYVAYGSGGACVNYHLGALLENPPLYEHAGASAKSGECSGSSYVGTDCTKTSVCLLASGGDFDGSSGNVFDVTP